MGFKQLSQFCLSLRSGGATDVCPHLGLGMFLGWAQKLTVSGPLYCLEVILIGSAFHPAPVNCSDRDVHVQPGEMLQAEEH